MPSFFFYFPSSTKITKCINENLPRTWRQVFLWITSVLLCISFRFWGGACSEPWSAGRSRVLVFARLGKRERCLKDWFKLRNMLYLLIESRCVCVWCVRQGVFKKKKARKIFCKLCNHTFPSSAFGPVLIGRFSMYPLFVKAFCAISRSLPCCLSTVCKLDQTCFSLGRVSAAASCKGDTS